jgi:competence transcription factor ComK
MNFLYAYKVSNTQPHYKKNEVYIRMDHISLYKDWNGQTEVQLVNGTWCIVPMSLEEFLKIMK